MGCCGMARAWNRKPAALSPSYLHKGWLLKVQSRPTKTMFLDWCLQSVSYVTHTHKRATGGFWASNFSTPWPSILFTQVAPAWIYASNHDWQWKRTNVLKILCHTLFLAGMETPQEWRPYLLYEFPWFSAWWSSRYQGYLNKGRKPWLNVVFIGVLHTARMRCGWPIIILRLHTNIYSWL